MWCNNIEDRSYCVADDVACPQWEESKSCNAENQTCNGKALVPCCVGKFLVVRIGYFLEKYLAYDTQDIDCRNNY